MIERPYDGCGKCLLGVRRLSRMKLATSSPERQREDFLTAAGAVGGHIIGWADDWEVSGATDPMTRPQVGPWLRDERGPHDGLVAAAVDRLGRKVVDCLNTGYKMRDEGKLLVLAGRLLAQAVEESEVTGEPARAVLHRTAHQLGEQLAGDDGPGVTGVFDLLERYGFEPRDEGDTIVLGNCPFRALAREHTQTVCGMNLHLLRGVLPGLEEDELQACLEPSPGHCCVRLRPATSRPATS